MPTKRKHPVKMNVPTTVRLMHLLFINQGGVSVERHLRLQSYKTKGGKWVDARINNDIAFTLN